MKALLATLLILAAHVAPALADEGPPQRPILHIGDGPGGRVARDLTRDDLEKLGTSTIRTTTPWYDGLQIFEGVPLDVLMRAVGARGNKLIVVALNRFQTEIPLPDAVRNRAILALKRNGQYMDVRDKGPLFIVFPFDENPALRSELYYGRSAWQVKSITVE